MISCFLKGGPRGVGDVVPIISTGRGTTSRSSIGGTMHGQKLDIGWLIDGA